MIEEPPHAAGAIASVVDPRAAVVFDCLAVWLGNLFHGDPDMDDESAPLGDLPAAARLSAAARLIFVINEVGWGIVPADPATRRFRDLPSRLNRKMAAQADRVICVLCGQAFPVKPPPAPEPLMPGGAADEGGAP